MALIKCKECGNEVSKDAKNCPKCGKQLKMGFFKKILIGFGVLFALAVIGSMGKKNDKGASAGTAGAATTQAQPTPRPAAAPATKVQLTQLLRDYKNNEVGADATYKDKLIEVSGKVGDIKKDITGSIYVTLGTGGAFEMPQVQAFFDDEWTSKAAVLNKGQQLTIKGRVRGLMMNVLVKDSAIVE